MNVVDSSVLLAFVQGEEGSDQAETVLAGGASCGAANWSEVAQKVRAAGRDWDLVRALLRSYDLTIESVVEGDAEWAARRWRRGESLSLADRLCLALADRLDVDVWTADTSWGSAGRVRQLR
ncbi:MAG: PIN domain-containing protein [Acidimicrobiales bacterium]